LFSFIVGVISDVPDLPHLQEDTAKGRGALYLRRPPIEKPSNRGSSAPHEVEDDRNNGQYQENVDKESGDVEHEEASQPQQKQNESKT
jgi:hypothetical protein